MSSPVFTLTKKDADRLRQHNAAEQDRRDRWPYVDVYCPPTADRIFARSAIVAPAAATPTVVVSYTIPQGLQAVITSVVFQTVASMFVQGSGDVLWTWDENTPLSTSPIQGSIIKNFDSVPFDLGTVQSPWPLPKPQWFKPNDTLRVKVLTTAAITQGAPQYFIAILNGWEWPVTE